MNRPSSVLITGASGGLGSALARHYAQAGVRLALFGRDLDRLDDVARDCRQLGADTNVVTADVTDAQQMAQLVQETDEAAPLDLIIACAGISGETRLPGEEPKLSAEIVSTNILGVLNTVEPVLPAMIARQRGRICLIASLGGLRGIARGPVYSASKAAVIVLGEGWRDALAPHNIAVTVACPGYLRTALTERHSFKLPFALTPETAAKAIARGISANRARVTVPASLAPVGWAFSALPASWTAPLLPGRGRPTPQPAGEIPDENGSGRR